jgi:hypothetical protein
VKVFPEESCPVVLITRFELSVERCPRGINSAWLTYIPEPELINGNQAANSLQFVVLPRQGDTKYKLRTDKQFGSDNTGAMPVTRQTKRTNAWLPASDRSVVSPFSEIPTLASKSDAADHQIVQFGETIPGIPALTRSIDGIVADMTAARKSVSHANFGFFAAVIAVEEFAAPVLSGIIQPLLLFPVFSGILKTIAHFAPPLGSQVIGAHGAIMGLCHTPHG